MNTVPTTSLEITPVVLALIATIPAIITGLATLISVIMMAKKQTAVAVKTDDKLNQIHVLVNSRLSEALGEISSLKETLGDKEGALAARQDARTDAPLLPLDKPATT